MSKYILNPNYIGSRYRLADAWLPYLTPDPTKPIRYAEIGAFHGANLVSFAELYGQHPDSVLVAIDPWIDYAEYPEYKGEQETNYATFVRNMEACGLKDRVQVCRGYSHKMIPTLDDDSFDVIYIDGNHEPEYVLEDAVLAFRKLKVGGRLIFDDYGWGGPDMTKKGIDAFAHAYRKRTILLGQADSQIFMQKKF